MQRTMYLMQIYETNQKHNSLDNKRNYPNTGTIQLQN